MKLKALAMAAMVGLGTLPMALQAAEVPEGPHVVTSGTASVDATPDIATGDRSERFLQRRRPCEEAGGRARGAVL